MNFYKTDEISCKPISNLDDLLRWSGSKNSITQKYRAIKLNRCYIDQLKNDKPQLLVCHDMKNNYLEDKYIQGFNCADSYSFYHWNLIDIFIYFSHHLVTIPPESWINAAHLNHCRILGTFITEFQKGKKICDSLFQNLDQVIQKLVDITVFYGFDGWLINIENKIDYDQMEKLKYFVDKLNQELKKIDQNLYKVIWYDSVINSGELKWQNELNSLNKQFFDISDGFFVNYTWKEENLANSKQLAGDRYTDVFVGVDVFGRGCLGDGGFNCNIPFEIIHKYELSIALFAPGWIHECNDSSKFLENSEKFWNLLSKFTRRKILTQLPILSSFSHSWGSSFFLNGLKLSNNWNNLNLQSLLPVLSDYDKSKINWDFEDALYGSNSIRIEPNHTQSLFELNVELNKEKIYVFEYCFKLGEELENFNGFYSFLECSDGTKLFDSNESNNNNNNNNLKTFIKLDSKKNSYGWNFRRFEFRLFDNIKVKNISLLNESPKSVKLGLIRLEEDKKNQDNKPSSEKKLKLNQIESENKIFRLNNEICLLIKLYWSIKNDNYKHFNIFLNKNNSGKDQDLFYVGSTRLDSFCLCLKLNDNIFLDSTLESENKNLSVKVFVQTIDHQLTDLDINSKHIETICIDVPKLKIRNNSDLTFFNNLIYDFEFF